VLFLRDASGKLKVGAAKIGEAQDPEAGIKVREGRRCVIRLDTAKGGAERKGNAWPDTDDDSVGRFLILGVDQPNPERRRVQHPQNIPIRIYCAR